MATYRKLTPQEIKNLEAQLCSCKDWNLIEVANGFAVERVHNVSFSGNIKLGVFQKEFTSESGVVKKSGIYNAVIHNCSIADDVYIKNISNQIANYTIEKSCFIENIDLLETTPGATFGHGVKVAVLDETGSREVPIYDKLTSATAYLLCTYKHNATITKAFHKLIEKEINQKQSDIGSIGENVIIRNSKSIVNVNIAAGSLIEGVTLLQNGTICSDAVTQTQIANGVIAKDFIIGKGSKVMDGSQLEACFVGEACLISKQFSAIHSLFFANCEMMHGEAVSVFAGPFTVSHHKSTLLIGGMFSFFNAGSGSNMSNHMYKIGPIHYGVMQRGCKMASDSYLMWPGKIGVFSVVIGKIKKHIDTSALPFSYIVDSGGGECTIMPAMNLTSVGTYRDCNKWKNRDGRKNADKLDNINSEFLNPFMISQIQTGIDTLNKLKEKNPTATAISYKGCKINTAFIPKAVSLYQMMIDIYLGDSLLQNKWNSNSLSVGKWLDAAASILPEKPFETILNDLCAGKLSTIESWNNALTELHTSSVTFESAWLAANFTKDKATIVNNAIAAQEKYLNLLLSDAKKEFSEETKICFGLDCDERGKEEEFTNLRGTFEKNTLIKSMQEENQKKEELLKALL
jgi:carbonic anhydrase/acetyltransferase-like protein (isoleucine patch superfamily)